MTNSKLEILVSYTKKEVESLLLSYEKYKDISKQIASGNIVNKSKTKFSFFASLGKMQNLDPVAKAKKELVEIGESMKFQNPLIWLSYKYLAYKNEPGKALVTLKDLREHCKVDGICFRRFDAINFYLRSKYEGLDLLSDSFISGDTNLESLNKDSRFLGICLDESFMILWASNENDKSGKWKNYQLSSN